MSFTLDYTSMLAANLGAHRGLSEPNLSAQRPIFAETLADLTTRRQTGELAFWDLPFNQEAIDQVKAFSRRRMDKFQDFVHLGIGGSALGPIALHAGLNHPQHNLLPSERRSGCRFFCPDNVDPDLIGGVLDVIDLPHSLFHIVTKSGGTSETIAQFLLLVDLLKKTRGESWREHLVITTDPQRGFMRQFAHEQKIQTFEIAPEVGGRFTVLTPVGLLPAAMTGINIDQLCRGAREISDSCFINNLEDNPAALLAALLFLADRQLKLPIQVLFAYSNRLDLMADWFRQLWAESLGKRVNLDGQERPCGPTPVKSVGATDQHSQVQL